MIIKPGWLKKFIPLIEMIRNNGAEAKFVGGCVRDIILGKQVKDFDLACNLLPEETMKILQDVGIKVIPTGLKHGTITVLFTGIPVEITTLRKDLECDGRHARVAFTNSWVEDAARRDFTFNALYLDIEGRIHDYFSGIEDLKNKNLNFVGDAEKRITEDYLRILRAFRFYANLEGCVIEEYALRACKKYAAKLENISGERIQAEMFKLLSYKAAFKTIAIMQDYNVLQQIFNAEINFKAINFAAVELIDNFVTKLAVIVRNADKSCEELAKWIFNRWKFKKEIYNNLLVLVQNELSNNVRRNLVEFGRENSIAMLEIEYTTNKINTEEFKNRKRELSNATIPQFPVMGRDVKKLGFKEREIGERLKYLHLKWSTSNYIMSKDELLDLIKRS